MSNHQVIFFDLFKNEDGKIFCCLGLINILGKEGHIALYANISDKINFMNFGLAADNHGTVYIVGGIKSNNHLVKKVLKIQVRNALKSYQEGGLSQEGNLREESLIIEVAKLKCSLQNALVSLS